MGSGGVKKLEKWVCAEEEEKPRSSGVKRK